MRRTAPQRSSSPGILESVAKTAVLAGTATITTGAIVGSQKKKQASAQQKQADAAQLQELEQEVAQMQAQQVAAAAPPPPAQPVQTQPVEAGPTKEDLLVQLSKLGELKAQGLLSEEEFAAAKTAILTQLQ